jgi:hypothetical protein
MCVMMQVILTDGDVSTLANMKANMEMNSLYIKDSQLVIESNNKVCLIPCVNISFYIFIIAHFRLAV